MTQATALEEIGDGLSKTILICEVAGRGIVSGRDYRGLWASGRNGVTVGPHLETTPIINPQPTTSPATAYLRNTATASLFADHPAGANVAVGDGSVRFLASKSAGETMSLPRGRRRPPRRVRAVREPAAAGAVPPPTEPRPSSSNAHKRRIASLGVSPLGPSAAGHRPGTR